MKYITIHASDTYPDMDIGVDEIRKWHTDPKPKGNGWRDVGYHYVIRRDGDVEKGRPDHVTGAHVGGFNTGNIGVCLVGGKARGSGLPEDNYTDAQMTSLRDLLADLVVKYPKATITGHNGFPGHENRGCPCFDWRAFKEEFYARDEEEVPQLPSHWLDEVDSEESK